MLMSRLIDANNFCAGKTICDTTTMCCRAKAATPTKSEIESVYKLKGVDYLAKTITYFSKAECFCSLEEGGVVFSRPEQPAPKGRAQPDNVH